MHAHSRFVPVNLAPVPADGHGPHAYNPEHHNKTKHIARRHFFVRDMVESFELNVPFVGTADNVADFFTKALDAKTFFRFRNILMNVRSAPA